MAIPTFSDLYIQRTFNAERLAAQANVPIDVIDRMLLEQAVPQELAEQVLVALSLLTRQHYSLDNVRIKLSNREQQEEMSHDDQSE